MLYPNIAHQEGVSKKIERRIGPFNSTKMGVHIVNENVQKISHNFERRELCKKIPEKNLP